MRKTITYVGLVAAMVLCIGAVAAVGGDPQESQHPVTAQKEKKLAQGEKEAKKMLLLMDKDMNGKVSKQEFMDFMEAEFERLDINHDGELDVKELTESRVQIRTRGR
jgi:Ca2+-binding EF-hand superfamily protein